MGVWQGFIAPFVFVISLFKSGLNIYGVHNNSAWYNVGYLFGLMCFFGDGGHQPRRRRQIAFTAFRSLRSLPIQHGNCRPRFDKSVRQLPRSGLAEDVRVTCMPAATGRKVRFGTNALRFTDS